MTQSETLMIVLLAAVVVIGYSFWGAHLLKSEASAASEHTFATTEQ